MMDLKEKIKQLKKKYGEFVVEIEGETFTFKPSVEFYEGLLVATSDPDTANEKGIKYFMNEFPKIVAKDLNISLEDAKLLVLGYADEFITSFVDAIGKKKKK